MTFDDIANKIVNSNEYKKLINEEHHGTNRYNHSLRVAKSTYYISKKLKMNYESVTRAALLHDFFFDRELNSSKNRDKYKNHPNRAVINSKYYFNITGIEEDIIKSHMYPIGDNKPNSKEAVLLCVTDKLSSIYEYSRFKFKEQLAVVSLFFINLITYSK